MELVRTHHSGRLSGYPLQARGLRQLPSGQTVPTRTGTSGLHAADTPYNRNLADKTNKNDKAHKHMPDSLYDFQKHPSLYAAIALYRLRQ